MAFCYHTLYLIVHVPSELPSLIILLSLCVQHAINHKYHARVTFCLSYIIFDGLSFNKIVDPGHLTTMMCVAHNQLYLRCQNGTLLINLYPLINNPPPAYQTHQVASLSNPMSGQ